MTEVTPVEVIEHLDFEPVCEYRNRGPSGDCGGAEAAVWVVVTARICPCQKVTTYLCCNGCWQRRNSRGIVQCNCGRAKHVPCMAFVLKVERIKP